MNVRIRKADDKDLKAVHGLIKELAEYEASPDEVTLTLSKFREDFRRSKPAFDILVVEYKREIIGMALYFFTYSTWKGKTLYIEDLMITEKYRNKGAGTKLFQKIIKIARENNVRKLALQVLEWNQPAIKFYKRWKGEFNLGWINFYLSQKQLKTIESRDT